MTNNRNKRRTPRTQGASPHNQRQVPCHNLSTTTSDIGLFFSGFFSFSIRDFYSQACRKATSSHSRCGRLAKIKKLIPIKLYNQIMLESWSFFYIGRTKKYSIKLTASNESGQKVEEHSLGLKNICPKHPWHFTLKLEMFAQSFHKYHK